MIRLTFDWTDPRFAALVANAYADEYIDQHTQVYETQRSYRFYIDQIELYEKKLRDAENELQSFISKANLANIELQKDLLLRNIGDLTSRLSVASVDAEQARTKLGKVQEMSKTAGAWIESPELGSQSLDRTAYLRILDDSFFKLKVERERMLTQYTPLSNEIKAIDAQLERLKNQKAESLMNLAKMEVTLLSNRQHSLKREIADENRKLEEINAKTLELRQLQRTRDMTEGIYQSYKKKAEDLRISDDLDARKISSVSVAVPAIPPLGAAYPRKGLIVGVAAFLGLFFGFAFSALREFFNHTFKDEDSVGTHLGAPFLLSVPMLPSEQKHSIFGSFSRGGAPGGQPSKTLSHLSADQVLLVLLSLATLSLCGYISFSDGAGGAETHATVKESQRVRETATMLNPPRIEMERPASPGFVSADQSQGAAPGRELASAPAAALPQKQACATRAALREPAEEERQREPVRAKVVVNEASGTEHVVMPGQSLIGILMHVYHVPEHVVYTESIALVKAANPNLANNGSLRAGQKIIIPEEVVERGRATEKRAGR